MAKTVLLFLTFIFLALSSKPQSCTTIGQTPVTAFPVCGVDTFSQQSVPSCANHGVVVPGCDATNASYADTNPYWYTFTCYSSGTLGFIIKPNNQNDDYDWQLYDITNHNPTEVYTNASLFVAGNWSGGHGNTGTDSNATSLIQCASDSIVNVAPTFSQMPVLIQGHKYLLLVSHWTPYNQSGYQLIFNGGSGSITDPNIPTLTKAEVECDHQTIAIKLSKSVRCGSLAFDGSDFSLSSALASITSATGANCDNGFDMDSVILKLSNPLPPGNYIIEAKMGNDANTLLDDCHNSVIIGDTASFEVVQIPPTPLDSITSLGCSPNSLQIVFSKPIHCATIASDGSDFSISGPSVVNIQSANGVCDTSGLSSVIQVNLTSPIVTGGIYQIKLAPGTDGNTIIDKCNLQTPSGSTLNFSAADTVSAQFSYQIFYGCKLDSIQFSNQEKSGTTQWQWTFDSVSQSSQQNPLERYAVFGNKSAQLIVSNGVCSDTSSTTIFLDNAFKANFSADSNLCPTDKATFANNSTGNIISWYWDFGDGTNSSDSLPAPHLYPFSTAEEKYIVKLIAKNNYGCFDTAAKQIVKVRSCYIDVPSGFTPNGDGKNDYLYPLNAYKATNVEFRVFNRYGQLVFETKDWTKKWDGTINGKPQPTGAYAWMLQYTEKDTGKKYFLKGTSILIR